jgi:hypothetical protein
MEEKASTHSYEHREQPTAYSGHRMDLQPVGLKRNKSLV